LHLRYISIGIRIKFVYEGYRVKVKVIEAKGRKSLFPQCKTSIGHNSGSIKYRVVVFAWHEVFGYDGSNGVTASFVT